jgi:spermidine synthase
MLLSIKRLVIWSIIGTGISTVTSQLVTVREFISQFHGNEITISLTLFCWLFLTGLGSLLARTARRSSPTLYFLLVLVMGFWPLLQVILIRAFRDTLLVHGVSPGFYQIFVYIMLTTAPYCLLIGFILPYALMVLQESNSDFTSGQLYMTDSMGDIAGGVVFSFVLVYWVSPFKTIAITSGVMMMSALLFFTKSRHYRLMVAAYLITLLFYGISLNSRLEIYTLSSQYGNIFRYLESPFGRIVITKEGPQRTFWESGIPLYSDGSTISSEEKIHYPLSQLSSVERVLLVSGGLGETMVEVSKHHPRYVDYVELDPYLTSTAQELAFIPRSPNLTLINRDGRAHIQETAMKYDAIIIDLPDPDTFQINRFFTREFFALTKRALSQKGILSFGVSYSPNYISEIEKEKLSIIYSTARLHFENIMVLPGEEAYFLCRDGELTPDVPLRLRMKSVETTYIEGFYAGNVTKERISQIQENLQIRPHVNTDFEPRVMKIVFREWFQKHGSSPKVFFAVLVGLSAVYLTLLKREEYVLFSTGLVTMGVEMLVIFTFQVMYGYIYLKIGAIVTTFLLGLLPGAILGNLQKGKWPGGLLFSDTVFLGLLFIFLFWAGLLRCELHPFIFLVYCVVFSFFCGYQFPLVTSMIGEHRSPAAGCLAADLTGAAVGTLITGTFLIPVWGIQWTIILLILVKFSSNMIILLVRMKSG